MGDIAVGTGRASVATSKKCGIERMGGLRPYGPSYATLNPVDGFDCQGCAWLDPPPGERKTAKFCENGATAVAEEATLRRLGPDFFASHSLSDLERHTDFWLGQQGRLTQPLLRRRDSDHDEPVSWDDAFGVIGSALPDLDDLDDPDDPDDPDEAIFYTSGKTSSEALQPVASWSLGRPNRSGQLVSRSPRPCGRC